MYRSDTTFIEIDHSFFYNDSVYTHEINSPYHIEYEYEIKELTIEIENPEFDPEQTYRVYNMLVPQGDYIGIIIQFYERILDNEIILVREIFYSQGNIYDAVYFNSSLY